MKVIYPGSFDPITLGHVNVIERASKIFDKIDIVLAINRNKKYLFPLEKRIELISKCLDGLENSHKIEIRHCNELIASFAQKNNYNIIIRGFRDLEDLTYEIKLQGINKSLSGIETMFIATETEFLNVSSKSLKEIASFGGDISKFVPKPIFEDVEKVFKEYYKNSLTDEQ